MKKWHQMILTIICITFIILFCIKILNMEVLSYYFNLSIEIQKKLSYIGSSCQFVYKEIYTFQKRSMLTDKLKTFGTFVNFCPDFSDYSDYQETCDCRLVKKNLAFAIYYTVSLCLSIFNWP